jgi:hypothetical protein
VWDIRSSTVTGGSKSPATCMLAIAETPNKAPRLLAIELLPKIWRPKPPNQYQHPEYADDIGDDVFVCRKYGKSLRHSTVVEVEDRTDVHLWDEVRDRPELEQGLRVGADATPELKECLARIIKAYWDCFYEEGARRPILGFEFCIDTGDAQPIACKQQTYGAHESGIILQHVEALLHNGWIEECFGPWASQIVLAAKPHQEHIDDIDEFVW